MRFRLSPAKPAPGARRARPARARGGGRVQPACRIIPPAPPNLHHVALPVSDLRASQDFYCRRLGFRRLWAFTLAREHARELFAIEGQCRFITLEGGWGRLELFSSRGLRPRPVPGQHVCLLVSDRGRLLRDLRNCGVRVHTIRREGSEIAFVRDPDGHLLELKPDTKEE